MPIQPGTRLGSYQVGELLGRGAMGVVYRAVHAGLDREAAVKVMQALAPSPAALQRFHREAKAIARLRHPNILAVYDYGEEDGSPYMIFEYLPGGSLADRMSAGRVADGAALRMLEGIAAGLDYAHELNLVHRDVKPANVLLGHRDLPVLADFGLVKLVEETAMTASGTTTGTPQYMAPEQVGGPGSAEVGPAAARYALAAVAYELLTGHLPFEADGLMKLLYAKLHGDPPPASTHRPELPPAVDAVLARGMAREPAERWESSTAFVHALREALTVPAAAPARDPEQMVAPEALRPAVPAPTSPGPRRVRIRTVAPVLVAILGIATVATAGVASLSLFRAKAPSGPAVAARTTPSATPSIASTPAPNLVPARGSLRRDITVFSGGQISNQGRWTDGVSQVTFNEGSIDLVVLNDVTGGSADPAAGQDKAAVVGLNNIVATCCQSVLTSGRYVADIRLTYDGSATFQWMINFSACCNFLLDTGKKVITLNGSQAPAPPANVSEIQPGQAITLAVLSDPPRYSVYIGDTQAANLTDSSSTGSPAFLFRAFGHPGTVRVSEVRVYNLPGS